MVAPDVSLCNYRSFKIHVVNFWNLFRTFFDSRLFTLYVVSALYCKFPVILDTTSSRYPRFLLQVPRMTSKKKAADIAADEDE